MSNRPPLPGRKARVTKAKEVAREVKVNPVLLSITSQEIRE
jgi:hypothetical protein